MIEIEENEQIFRVIHRHWFIMLGQIFFLFITLVVPILTLFVLRLLPLERVFVFQGDPFYAGGFLFFSWILIVWMLGWKLWTTYYLDVTLITNKRIFDIDQRGLFDRESGSFRIDRIQNITVDQKGIIATLLDFGSIRFETAGGDHEDFVEDYVPRPYEIKKLINAMQDGTLDRTQEVHLHSDSIERLAVLQGDTGTTVTHEEQYRGGKLGDTEGL